MGCASCGQKYSRNAARVRQFQRRPAVRKGITPMIKPTIEIETPPVTVQPQPDGAIPTPVPTMAIDPSTGLPVSQIKTGNVPEYSLGNTAIPTDGMISESYGKGD